MTPLDHVPSEPSNEWQGEEELVKPAKRLIPPTNACVCFLEDALPITRLIHIESIEQKILEEEHKGEEPKLSVLNIGEILP